MSRHYDKTRPQHPLAYHGHIKGLILRQTQTRQLELLAFNTSTGPWAKLDGRNNLPYLQALGCERLVTLDQSSRTYDFDGEVVAIVLHDLTADDAVVIRLRSFDLAIGKLLMDLTKAG